MSLIAALGHIHLLPSSSSLPCFSGRLGREIGPPRASLKRMSTELTDLRK